MSTIVTQDALKNDIHLAQWLHSASKVDCYISCHTHRSNHTISRHTSLKMCIKIVVDIFECTRCRYEGPNWGGWVYDYDCDCNENKSYTWRKLDPQFLPGYRQGIGLLCNTCVSSAGVDIPVRSSGGPPPGGWITENWLTENDPGMRAWINNRSCANFIGLYQGEQNLADAEARCHRGMTCPLPQDGTFFSYWSFGTRNATQTTDLPGNWIVCDIGTNTNPRIFVTRFRDKYDRPVNPQEFWFPGHPLLRGNWRVVDHSREEADIIAELCPPPATSQPSA